MCSATDSMSELLSAVILFSNFSMRLGWRSPRTVPSDRTRSFMASCCCGEHPSPSLHAAAEMPHSLILSAVMLFTRLWKLSTSEFDLVACQSSLRTFASRFLPAAIDASRVTITQVLLEMVFSLEHLVFVLLETSVACMRTVGMLCAMPQIGVPPRICLATPDLVASPGFVQRALAVFVQTLQVLEFESAF
jgi:hypothetical protein